MVATSKGHFAFIPMQLLSLPLDAVEVYVHVYEVTIRHPALVPQFALCSEHFAARFRQQRDKVALKRVVSYGAEGVGDTVDCWFMDGVRGKKRNRHRSQSRSVDWRQGHVIGIACHMCTRAK